MNKQYDDTNRVIVWLNENEEGSRRPKIEINGNFKGENFRLALFANVTRTGKVYLSGTIEEPTDEAPPSSQKKFVVPKNDDGVPF